MGGGEETVNHAWVTILVMRMRELLIPQRTGETALLLRENVSQGKHRQIKIAVHRQFQKFGTERVLPGAVMIELFQGLQERKVLFSVVLYPDEVLA